MRALKHHLAPVGLGMSLAAVIFGVCFVVSIQRDRDVLRDVIDLARTNEDRFGEVLRIQLAMTQVMQDILATVSADMRGGEELDELRAQSEALEGLSLHQQTLMQCVSLQRLPPAPLRIWTSRKLRNEYFAERARIQVLQEHIEPLAVSADYLSTALASHREGNHS